MPIHAFDLVAKSFSCPSFHSCTLMDSQSDCKKELQKGAATLCENVSTHFVNLIRHSNGKRSWYHITNQTYPGPDRVMALLHHEGMEKAYNYVAENGLYLAAAGIGAFAVGYLAYRTYEKLTRTPECLKNIEFSELPSRLKQAEVDEENGIYLEGESESISYRQVSRHIEHLYTDSVKFMRQRQDMYEGRSFLMFFRTPPALNHYEEAQVRSAMQLRERAYVQLNALQSPGIIIGTLTLLWKAINYSRYLNYPRHLNSFEKDENLLQEMVSRRKSKESIKPNLEWGSRVYAEGKTLQSRIIFAAATMRGVVELVRHVAQMAIYSCFALSKTWGDTVALVAKDALEDLDNLKTAALGVLNPESVPVTKAKDPIILWK